MKFIVELSPGVYLGTGKSSTFHTNDITKASPCDTRDNAIQKRWRHKKRTRQQFPQSRIVAVDTNGIEFKEREEFAPTQIPGIPQIEDDAILEWQRYLAKVVGVSATNVESCLNQSLLENGHALKASY
jgi:hypothetical protein